MGRTIGHGYWMGTAGLEGPPRPPPPLTFGPATYRVGVDIPAGTYRTRDNRDSCYWERLSGFSGDFADIIANDFTNTSAGVTISSGHEGFRPGEGCGTWGKVG